MFRVILLVWCSMLAANSYAENLSSSIKHTIGEVFFYSHQDSIYPHWAGAVQLHLSEDIIWSKSTDCNTRDVAIRGDDSHLVSAVMAAKASGSKVQLFVDDSLKIVSTICYLRALSY